MRQPKGHVAEPLSDQLVAALGHLVLRYVGAGALVVVGLPPAWAARFPRLTEPGPIHLVELLDTFPFLESALTDLDGLWLGARDTLKGIGEWMEGDTRGHDIHLTASVLSLEGNRLIVVSATDEAIIDLIRRARENIQRRTP
jgi:hypothetical protein